MSEDSDLTKPGRTSTRRLVLIAVGIGVGIVACILLINVAVYLIR